MENKYSVIYYDLEDSNSQAIVDLAQEIENFHKRINQKFLLLPKSMKQEWVGKKEALMLIDNLRKEVETWEE